MRFALGKSHPGDCRSVARRRQDQRRTTMLMTAPGPNIEPLHDRQVFVLPVQDWASWLNLDKPEADLLKPLPAGSLRVALVRAGKEKSDPPLLELHTAIRVSSSASSQPTHTFILEMAI